MHKKDDVVGDGSDVNSILKEGSIDGKIMYVWNLLRSNPEYRLRLRFMLISGPSILRVNKGYMREYRQLKELTLVRNLSYFNRGKILEAFIKVETIIIDLVLARLIGLFERAPKLETMIERMDISKKNLILRDCGAIDTDLFAKLESLFHVRNGIAHSWSMDEVKYLNDPLKDNFKKFKEDFEVMWIKIIQVYMQEQAQKIEPFIKKMESEISLLL